jgi:hypothetical protein
VYLKHGSITSGGSACQGPAINPTLLDEVCAWRVRAHIVKILDGFQ